MTKEIEQYIIENYERLSIKSLIEYTKVSQVTIIKIAKKNNLKLKSAKKYSSNESYFSKIDNEQKAYWLGFLFADGYVRMHKGRSAELKLKLATNDKEHIELFKKSIESTHPIKDIKSEVIYNNKKSVSYCSTFSVNSKKIVTDLFNIGCNNNKTFTVEMPNIDDIYIRDFIRGYFDGDGCIYTNKNNGTVHITSGSLTILEQIKEIIYKKLNIMGKINKYKNTYRVRWDKKIYIEKIYNYLYDDSNISLNRKKIHFIDFLSQNTSHKN